MSSPFEPSSIRASPRRAEDPRLGHLIRPSEPLVLPGAARVALVGFPSDEGVRTNGGRVGAADGPDRIRHWLYRLTPDAARWDRHVLLLERTFDLGNLRCTRDVAADQETLAAALVPMLQRDVVPIILGGGHETTFGHFLGHVGAGHEVSIFNVDAHADVRPLVEGRPHSGSPFRQAIEHESGACRGYTVVGLSRCAVTREHVDYLAAHGARCLWSDSLDGAADRMSDADCPVLATFDLDALDQSYAPGVSAPNACGLTPGTWLTLAAAAGRNAHVASFDVVELNPRHDRDEATARLAALTVWEFIRGVAER